MSDAKSRRTAALATPTDLGSNATRDVGAALNLLLADAFAVKLASNDPAHRASIR